MNDLSGQTAVSKIDAIRLEYGFLAAHLNSLVLIRYTYFGTYLAAFGWLTTKSLTLFSLISAAIVTLVVWCIELRTRVLIRACTGRLVEIEETYLSYEGFFWKSHPYQRKNPPDPTDRTTTPGIVEKVRILFWERNIPSSLGFSKVMDIFFNIALLLIVHAAILWFCSNSPVNLAV